MAKAGYKKSSATHDITLYDGMVRVGLVLDAPPREDSQSASDLYIQSGGTRYGSGDPSFTHEEKRDWIAGRGIEDMFDDNSGYYDSLSLWSLTPNRLLPAPQWKLAKGLRSEDRYLPGNVTWKNLIDDERYISISFVASASYSADKAYMWIKRQGSPGTLTVELCADSSGDPGSVAKTVTKTTDDITDIISVFQIFDWTGTSSLTSGTTYHLKIYGASTDNIASHWKIAVDAATTGGKYSTAGSSWSSATYKPFYRVVDADVKRDFIFFRMKNQWYAVSKNDDGTASKLFINGWRGVATSATATRITDTNNTFTADALIGWYIKIIGGTGKGQVRIITDNGTGDITFSDMDITPDATSEYVVYGGDTFTELGTTGLGTVKDVCVYNDIAHFAQGAGDDVRRMRFNEGASPPAHEYEDDANSIEADLIILHYFESNTPKIVCAANDNVDIYTAPLVAWATGHTAGSDNAVGDDSYLITGLQKYANQLFVLKEDGTIWYVANDETVTPLEIGTNAIPLSTNGIASVVNDYFLYFNWSHSIEKLYRPNASMDATLDDVGPWKRSGMPDGRQGYIASMDKAYNWIFAAMDAGDDTSCILVMNEVGGYAEIFRAWEAGQRIRHIAWQSVQEGRPRLWFSVGGDIGYMEFPKYGPNPIKDSGINYQHESVVVESTIDMNVTDWPKYIDRYALISENLSSGKRVGIDYQLDSDIGGTDWITLSDFTVSPKDTKAINRGEVKRIRIRKRFMTNTSTTPPIEIASVLRGFTKTPSKRQWAVRARVSAYQTDKRGRRDMSPDEVLEYLYNATEAKVLTMRSGYKNMDRVNVIIPRTPVLTPSSLNQRDGKWTGTLLLTIREA